MKRPIVLPDWLRALRRRGMLPSPRTLRALRRLCEELPTRGNKVELHTDGDRLYERMLEDISSARTRISLEIYMFCDDQVGQAFSAALRERAAAGVDVRVIYDALGSLETSSAFFDRLSGEGIEVIAYHPIAPWKRGFAIFGRDHRKILVVDGVCGFAGGMNIGCQWSSTQEGGSDWRDTHVRVEGPAAGDLEVLVEDTWYRETGRLLELDRLVPRDTAGASTGVLVSVVAGPATSHRRIQRSYTTALGQARSRVRITSSYFIPNRRLRRAIRAACQRGVVVELILPQHNDVALAHHASRRFYDRLLRWGVHLHLYQPTILHAKTAVIDSTWAIVGSGNLDSLSINFNLESNLILLGKDFGKEMDNAFDEDLARSHRIDLQEWRRRPWRLRLFERLCALLRYWL